VNSQIGKNACYANKDCPHLCLATVNGSFTCACPDGLVTSGTNCFCPDGKPTINGACGTSQDIVFINYCSIDDL